MFEKPFSRLVAVLSLLLLLVLPGPVATASPSPASSLAASAPGLAASEQPASPAVAGPVDPSYPAGRGMLGAPAPGAQLDARGRWYMTAGPEGSGAISSLTAATGGPDDFGYTWNDGVTLNWIDVSSGTDTGLTGDSYGKVTGLISLPFALKYYENRYNGLYIAASGYVAFTQASTWNDQDRIPSPNPPNNVIAPYWTIIYIGSGAWVRYRSAARRPTAISRWSGTT